MSLAAAMVQRQEHRRASDGTCRRCGEAHPCPSWRLARAQVLVLVRAAFAAARAGGACP
jgi:hypothetical protein